MTDGGPLDRLADMAGIEPGYWDIWGKRHDASADTKRTLLAAMGLDVASDGRIAESLQAAEADAWRRALPPVLVVHEIQPAAVQLTLPAAPARDAVTLDIVAEDGAARAVSVVLSEIPVSASHEVAGTVFQRRRVALPRDLPLGYHQVSVRGGDGDTMRLIVAPRTCHLPGGAGDGGRLWGFTVHLYAVRSPRNWGIGDFTDLVDLVEASARVGAAGVGVNPLHALFPGAPDQASPYSPSSRIFLNPIYIDVEAVPEFAGCPEAQRVLWGWRKHLAAARADSFVNYPVVTRLKYAVLRAVHGAFRRSAGAERARARAFASYVEAGGERLHRFAVFESLAERFGTVPWPQWPEGYRSPMLPDVRAFAAAHAADVEFHAWLQWIAEEQVSRAQRRAEHLGMPLGLYRDLAVGVAEAGSDAWSAQDVIITDASVGCPPDPFNMLGQDWGTPPMSPRSLREKGYEPFIAMVRANMRNAGALRIDHVMGLLHLFWIPVGETPARGAYVEYPFEDLLAIVALESRRARCMVIGEDLGTVPDGFRERMAAANVLSYRVFYFEKDGDRFKRPDEYPAQALACVTTHDLATLAGFWSGADILLRKEIGLYPSPAVEQSEWESRKRDRELMQRALAEQGLLPGEADRRPGAAGALSPAMVGAVHAYLARSPARIVMAQLDDVSEEAEQLNLPGTVLEYANWRRRLSQDIDTLFASPVMTAIRDAMAERSIDGE